MSDYQNQLENALKAENVFTALYETAVFMRDDGLTKDDVYAQFEVLHLQLSKEGDETRYNAILDVMDCIMGWCSPHLKIFV